MPVMTTRRCGRDGGGGKDDEKDDARDARAREKEEEEAAAAAPLAPREGAQRRGRAVGMVVGGEGLKRKSDERMNDRENG
jgi:hypothetical protein